MAVATDLDLDVVEVPPAVESPGAVAWRAWNATWPKLLAIAIVIGGWQLAVWSHWKPEFLVPSPFTVLDRLFHEPGTMLSASWVTLSRGVRVPPRDRHRRRRRHRRRARQDPAPRSAR